MDETRYECQSQASLRVARAPRPAHESSLLTRGPRRRKATRRPGSRKARSLSQDGAAPSPASPLLRLPYLGGPHSGSGCVHACSQWSTKVLVLVSRFFSLVCVPPRERSFVLVRSSLVRPKKRYFFAGSRIFTIGRPQDAIHLPRG